MVCQEEGRLYLLGFTSNLAQRNGNDGLSISPGMFLLPRKDGARREMSLGELYRRQFWWDYTLNLIVIGRH